MSDWRDDWLDLTAAANLVARREVKAIELVEFMLARVARLNPELNAYVTVLGSAARTQAMELDAEIAQGRLRGPLHGVTIGVKDLIHVAGVPSTGGSRSLGGFVASKDAECVARLRAAGAIILGKLHTHELAGGATSENELYGRACNPWNKAYIPGGSSGGSGVATAAGLVHAALGTDTGGSVRMPAAFCGVVGFKGTFGRVSRRGVFSRSWTMDHVGSMARSVRDAALVYQAMVGHDPGDPYSNARVAPDSVAELNGAVAGLRVGVVTGTFFESRLDPQIGAAFEDAVGILTNLGMKPRKVTFDLAAEAHAAGTIITVAEAAAAQDEVMRARPAELGQDIRDQLRMAEFITARQYIRALRVRAAVQQELTKIFEDVDVLVTPATAVLPTRSDRPSSESLTLFARYARPFSMPGLPAISVPAGFSVEGLPIGLQIVGRPFDESGVLRVAHAYEQATAWHRRRPEIETYSLNVDQTRPTS